MKIPKKIQLMGKTFKVVLVAKIDDDNGWGEASHHNCYIKIKKSLNSQTKMETFIHEILHLVYGCAGIKENERDIEITANILYQVFQQIK